MSRKTKVHQQGTHHIFSFCPHLFTQSWKEEHHHFHPSTQQTHGSVACCHVEFHGESDIETKLTITEGNTDYVPTGEQWGIEQEGKTTLVFPDAATEDENCYFCAKYSQQSNLAAIVCKS